MILFIETIVALALIAFPIVKTGFKGVVDFQWIRGLLIGANYGSMFFRATVDDEKKVFQMYTLQFHVAFITITMAFSVERPNAEVHE